MRNFKKVTSGAIVAVLLAGHLSFLPSISFAAENSSVVDKIIGLEISDSFNEYLHRPEEERNRDSVIPIPFNVYSNEFREAQNPFLKSFELGATSASYSLRNTIANNVTVKDQKSTNTCWAFAGVSAMENGKLKAFSTLLNMYTPVSVSLK